MNIQEPKCRYGTTNAISALVSKYNLPYEDWMQDWPYEIVDPGKIDVYLKYYDQVNDEDERFCLMQLLIQATEDQTNSIEFNKYWIEVQKRLIKDYFIHEYSIWYWCLFKSDHSDNWQITPYMRALWFEKNQ